MRADLDAFLEHLRSERQVSAHTLDGYRRDLLKILALAEKAGLSDWNALDTRSLRTFVARLHQQGQSSRSLHGCSRRRAASTSTCYAKGAAGTTLPTA